MHIKRASKAQNFVDQWLSRNRKNNVHQGDLIKEQIGSFGIQRKHHEKF